jgi:sarcosine oxidase
LDASQLEQRFPPFKLTGRERGYYEPTAGYLVPEACVDAQISLAREYGAEIHTGERVVEIGPDASGVTVITESARYTAGKAILSLGAWISKFLDTRYAPYFKVYRQVLYWYEVDGSIDAFKEPHFPVWIWEFGRSEEEMAYGFPAIDGPRGGVKIAFEQLKQTTDPDAADREVSVAEVKNTSRRYVKPLFHEVSDRLVKAATCLYTVTPGYRFLLDVHPEHSDLIVASPCSGHGFKHSAAIGESLAQLAVGDKTTVDLSPFSFARLLQESQID